MMKFSDKNVNSTVSDELVKQLVFDIGPGPWAITDIQRMVDAGCAAAIKTLHSMDPILETAVEDIAGEPERDLVQVVMISMMIRTLQQALDVMMAESFLKMMGIIPPRG